MKDKKRSKKRLTQAELEGIRKALRKLDVNKEKVKAYRHKYPDTFELIAQEYEVSKQTITYIYLRDIKHEKKQS